jgi:hypothetical protein
LKDFEVSTMDIVTILGDLWRLRRYVAVVLVLAVLAAAGVKFMLPSYGVGVSSAQILVDTPSSQVVNVSPTGSDTTGARADLLASLMVDGQLKADIAQRAGVPPSRLVGITSAANDPTGTAVTAPSGPNAFVLNTQVLTTSTGVELPIIEVDTQAPTRAQAAKLASGAVAGLGAYLNTKAALEKVTDADRLQVSGMGLPQSSVQAQGTSPVVVVLIFVFVLLAGCGAILGIRAVVRRWRAASLRERMGDQALPAWELPPDEAYETYEEPVVPDRVEEPRPAQEAAGDERIAANAPDSEQIVSPPPHDWLAHAEGFGPASRDAAGGHDRLPRRLRRRAFGGRDDRTSEQEVG